MSAREQPDDSIHEDSIDMLKDSMNPGEVGADEFRLEEIQNP
jgi:hypothetical protein